MAGMKDGTIEHVGFRQRGAMLTMQHTAAHAISEHGGSQGGSRAPASATGAVAAAAGAHPRVGGLLAPAPLPASEMLVPSGAATEPTAAAMAIDQRGSPAAASSTQPQVRPGHRAAAVAAGSGAMKVARVSARPTAAAQGGEASDKPTATAASGAGAGRSAAFSRPAAGAAPGKALLAGKPAALQRRARQLRGSERRVCTSTLPGAAAFEGRGKPTTSCGKRGRGRSFSRQQLAVSRERGHGCRRPAGAGKAHGTPECGCRGWFPAAARCTDCREAGTHASHGVCRSEAEAVGAALMPAHRSMLLVVAVATVRAHMLS
jgi:hypothetical protein